MLFDLLDRVRVTQTGRIGVINKIETVETLEYFYESGQQLTKVEYRYFVMGVKNPFYADELTSVPTILIDKI
jgi:hypothetical protein